jgi:subtilisin family serine protease
VAAGARIDADGRVSTDTVDRLGHGTAVAAAIRDQASDAEIVPVKVFDRELRATVEALEAAIDWAVAARVDVINLSLGTANPAHEARLAAAVARAAQAGVWLVAAGTQDDIRWLPGALPGAVAVQLDWALDRHEVRVDADPADGSILTLHASGYPRPIPGVPPERNLKGISFAVANATGLLCLHLTRR